MARINRRNRTIGGNLSHQEKEALDKLAFALRNPPDESANLSYAECWRSSRRLLECNFRCLAIQFTKFTSRPKVPIRYLKGLNNEDFSLLIKVLFIMRLIPKDKFQEDLQSLATNDVDILYRETQWIAKDRASCRMIKLPAQKHRMPKRKPDSTIQGRDGKVVFMATYRV